MTREEAKELIPFYAIDALDADEANALEGYLRDASAEIQQELRSWHEVVSLLPLALPEVVPPPSLRTQLFDRISVPEYIDLPEPTADPFMEPVETMSTESAAPSPSVSESLFEETTAKVLPFAAPAKRRFGAETQRWMLLAASILLVLTSAYFYRRNSHLETERASLQAKVQEIEKEKESLLTSLNKTTRVVDMEGMEGANAKVIWDTKENAWRVYVSNLPAPPSDKDYQLWFVTKTQKLSAKVFSTNERGQTVFSFVVPPEIVKGLAATAVTLEPKGGSPQPTGDRFYLKAAI
jgi:anti-sigma-K factor RskA